MIKTRGNTCTRVNTLKFVIISDPKSSYWSLSFIIDPYSLSKS